MTYAVSIDWLSLFCRAEDGNFSEIIGGQPLAPSTHRRAWGYKLQPHGSRQFAKIVEVSLAGEDFAVIQFSPYDGNVLNPDSVIVKLANRVLYTASVFYDLQCFIEEHGLKVESVSRCDICADFNAFRQYDCVQFIADFLSSKIRHKGRGKGAAHFNHYAAVNGSGCSVAHLDYTGLAFGSNESDVRVYLYNKTFELLTVKDKPYIKQFWRDSGLDVTKNVWRLEVSIKSGGRKFKNKLTGAVEEITTERLRNMPEVVRLYHTFVHKYWAFVKNRPNITNISREPIIELFTGAAYYLHGALRSVSGGNRTERILIKQLWQMAETYRGDGLHTDEGATKLMADNLAEATGLRDWLYKKQQFWDKPKRK